MASTIVWEKLSEATVGGMPQHHGTFRARVQGGWLVAVWSQGPTKGMSSEHNWCGGITFVPDPSHTWHGPDRPAG
jgi:hypothetical protein